MQKFISYMNIFLINQFLNANGYSKIVRKKPFADDIINTNMHLLQGRMYILDIFRHLDIYKYLICIQQWVNLFHVEVH